MIETLADPPLPPRRSQKKVAREIFAAFAATFMAARVLVYLIMSHRLPDLFLHVGETHVHHLNYGIFLLSAVGGLLLLYTPTGGVLRFLTIAYGIGLALTFDEFGMWLHLGGGYWQRASFDAVTVIGALLGVLAFAPSLKHLGRWHWLTAAVLAVMTLAFLSTMFDAYRILGFHFGEHFRLLENAGPP